jgi:hypothetical protein
MSNQYYTPGPTPPGHPTVTIQHYDHPHPYPYNTSIYIWRYPRSSPSPSPGSRTAHEHEWFLPKQQYPIPRIIRLSRPSTCSAGQRERAWGSTYDSIKETSLFQGTDGLSVVEVCGEYASVEGEEIGDFAGYWSYVSAGFDLVHESVSLFSYSL